MNKKELKLMLLDYTKIDKIITDFSKELDDCSLRSFNFDIKISNSSTYNLADDLLNREDIRRQIIKLKYKKKSIENALEVLNTRELFIITHLYFMNWTKEAIMGALDLSYSSVKLAENKALGKMLDVLN